VNAASVVTTVVDVTVTTVVDVTVEVVVDVIVTTVVHVNHASHAAMHQRKSRLKTNSKTNFVPNLETLAPTPVEIAATVIVAVDNTL
jgi:hypothetical protein